MGFEWRTEEEEGVDGRQERMPAPEQRTPPGRLSQRLLLLALALALLAVAAVVIWRQVDHRVTNITDTVREEVLASHALARRAAGEKDGELMASILSARSGQWMAVQEERLRNGLLFDESLRPFDIIPLAGLGGDVDVMLNPPLTEAVVEARRPFAVDAGRGLTTTIYLTRTYIYRKGSQRWLWSPADPSFWGAMETIEGDLVTVIAPERDREVVSRLAAEIEASLGELCRQFGPCPEEYHVRLRLEPDPSTLVEAAAAVPELGPERTLTLPAPTLLGRPADEESLAALARAYARRVVVGAMTELMGYECCSGILFYRALLDVQLAQMGLRPPPQEDDAYRHLLDIPSSIDHLADLWDAGALPPGERRTPPEIYTFLEFLERLDGGSTDDAQRLLRAFGGTFWEWLENGGWQADRAAIENGWKEFVQEKLREGRVVASRPPNLTLPDQDLVAVCGDDRQEIYRYDLRAGQWSKEAEVGFTFALITTLPEKEGYLVAGQLTPAGDGPRYQTLLLRQNAEPIALAGDGQSGSFLLPWGTVGGRVVVLTVPNASETDRVPEDDLLLWALRAGPKEDGASPVALLDPASCDDVACALEPLPGIPIGSPAGSERMMVQRFAEVLHGFDGLAIAYGPGGSKERLTSAMVWPFWLDDETFGFVDGGRRGPRHPYVYIMDVRSGEMSLLLTSDRALAAIPEERQPATLPPTLRFLALLPHPTDPNSVLALAAPHAGHGERYLLEVRRTHEQESWAGVETEVSLLAGFEGLVRKDWRDVAYTLNGRWLTVAVRGYAPRDGVRLLMYDLEARRFAFKSAAPGDGSILAHHGDWSAGGDWFARPVEGRIDLIAPGVTVDGRPARHAIFHAFERCTAVAWAG